MSIDKWTYFPDIQRQISNALHKLLNGITIRNAFNKRDIEYISSPDNLKEIIDSSVNEFVGLQMSV